MSTARTNFDLLAYLAQAEDGGGDSARLPTLSDLSKRHRISISSLREQLEVAKAMGLVEVRPRTGIRRLPYSFTPAVRESLSYAIALDRAHFDAFSDLRRHLEDDYWYRAVEQLTPDDITILQSLVERAWEKLHDHPIRIPHAEHRQLHLTIFSHLENPFVLGILEAYWDAYEEVGLSRYTGIDYLEKVWEYHRKMVAAIREGDFEAGHAMLVEHMELINLIYRRENSNSLS